MCQGTQKPENPTGKPDILGHPNPRGLYPNPTRNPTFKTRKPEIFSGYPKYRNFDQKSGHFCLKNLKIFPLKIFPKKDEVFH